VPRGAYPRASGLARDRRRAHRDTEYPFAMRIGAGRFRNALLPKAGPDVRPVPGRLRQSLFTMLHPRLAGARVLDLCAGVGGLGLEALSRGAASVVLVDRDRRTAEALRRWITDRGVTAEASVVVADARRGGWPPGPYDLVFLDPPFAAWGGGSGEPAGEGISAFLAAAVAGTAPGGVVAVKLPTDAVLPEDPRWKVLDRRAQGEVASAILAPAASTTSPPPPRSEQPP
jgi:16S rRNA (guanine966-N2)-methyltransferase